MHHHHYHHRHHCLDDISVDGLQVDTIGHVYVHDLDGLDDLSVHDLDDICVHGLDGLNDISVDDLDGMYVDDLPDVCRNPFGYFFSLPSASASHMFHSDHSTAAVYPIYERTSRISCITPNQQTSNIPLSVLEDPSFRPSPPAPWAKPPLHYSSSTFDPHVVGSSSMCSSTPFFLTSIPGLRYCCCSLQSYSNKSTSIYAVVLLCVCCLNIKSSFQPSFISTPSVRPDPLS